MLNFDFLQKSLNDFSKKMFLLLYSIKGTVMEIEKAR